MRTALTLIALVLCLAGCATDRPQSQAEQQKPPERAAPSHIPDPPLQRAPATTGGLAPVLHHIDTTKPYVFLTIDDGEVRDPAALSLITDTRPTLFLNAKYFRTDPDYFKAIRGDIGDHTVDHPNLRGKPYEFQRKEICDDADAAQQAFGKRPTLFRPPFGNYDENTRRAAADCGMVAVVLWTETINNGAVQFQVGHGLRPGDIVLMHFRKTFTEDYQAFLRQAAADGVTPMPLVDFLA